MRNSGRGCCSPTRPSTRNRSTGAKAVTKSASRRARRIGSASFFRLKYSPGPSSREQAEAEVRGFDEHRWAKSISTADLDQACSFWLRVARGCARPHPSLPTQFHHIELPHTKGTKSGDFPHAPGNLRMCSSCAFSGRRNDNRRLESKISCSVRNRGSGRFGSEHFQLFEAKPGPGFIAGQVLYSFNNWNKLRSQNAAAAADNSLVSNLHNVNNSKVDVTHLSTVIVDHCNGGLVHYIYVHFLLQFSPHSVVMSDTA